MTIIIGRDKAIVDWVSAKLESGMTNIYATLGVIDGDGNLRGAAVLHNWSKYDMELTYYGPMTLSASMLRALTETAVHSGVQRMTVRIKRRNRSLAHSLIKVGWSYEGIQRRLYGPARGDDAILYGMLVSEAVARLLPSRMRVAA